MAGDEDKKVKKKKVKKVDKTAEEAPPPESKPAPPAAAKGEDVPAASKKAEPAPEAPAPADGEAPPAADEEGAVPADGEVIAEPPPAPKKKPKFFIHWNRKKPRFYDYNFDYGQSYYSPVVSYLDNKNLGARDEIPRRLAFAERGISTSIVRKSTPDLKTQNILHEVQGSIRGFETFQRIYAHDLNRKYI